MAVSANEDVLGFKIAVDDACCVQAFDAFHNLSGVESGPIST
jgi:hypothetical protein